MYARCACSVSEMVISLRKISQQSTKFEFNNKKTFSTAMSKGIKISVTAETNAGGRRHMEDYLAVKLYPNDRLRQVPHLREQSYIGVFDGHGGKEAAKFARERLWEVIQDQPKYQLNDVESVCESLREAYLAIHREMEPLRGKQRKGAYTFDGVHCTFYPSTPLLSFGTSL